MLDGFDLYDLHLQVAATQFQKEQPGLPLGQAIAAAKAAKTLPADMGSYFFEEAPAVCVADESRSRRGWIYLGDPEPQALAARMTHLGTWLADEDWRIIRSRNLPSSLVSSIVSIATLQVISDHVRDMWDENGSDDMWREWEWFCRWCDASETSITKPAAMRTFRRDHLCDVENIDEIRQELNYLVGDPAVDAFLAHFTPGNWERLKACRAMVAIPDDGDCGWRVWWHPGNAARVEVLGSGAASCL